MALCTGCRGDRLEMYFEQHQVPANAARLQIAVDEQQLLEWMYQFSFCRTAS
jgi:hypothetical protein